MSKAITCDVPTELSERRKLGRALQKRCADIMAYVGRRTTSNRLSGAINGLLIGICEKYLKNLNSQTGRLCVTLTRTCQVICVYEGAYVDNVKRIVAIFSLLIVAFSSFPAVADEGFMSQAEESMDRIYREWKSSPEERGLGEEVKNWSPDKDPELTSFIPKNETKVGHSGGETLIANHFGTFPYYRADYEERQKLTQHFDPIPLFLPDGEGLRMAMLYSVSTRIVLVSILTSRKLPALRLGKSVLEI